jgi:hypothetical protein
MLVMLERDDEQQEKPALFPCHHIRVKEDILGLEMIFSTSR